MYLIASVTEKQIKFQDKKAVERLKQVYKGKLVGFELEEIGEIRSLNLNRFHFGVVVRAFIEGYKEQNAETITRLEAHEILKYNCNSGEFIDKSTGELIRYGKDTKGLTNKQFIEFIERCMEFISSNYFIEVLWPDEKEFRDYYDKIMR